MSGASVGFVGVGNMGGAMALRALSQGVDVVAYDAFPAARDRLADAGAAVVASAAEVARRCTVVSVVVNYDRDVIAALLDANGVLEGAATGSVVAIHSTIHLETLERVAAAAAARGVTVVDAAVTGGVAAAERGTLAVMLGGDAAAVDRARAAVSSYASVVMHAGELGTGLSAKLAVNLIGFAKMASAYEGLALAEAAGVDVLELARVVAHSEQQSGQHEFFLAARAQTLATGDESLREIADHEAPKSQKDLHAALELAARLGIELPLATVAHDAMPTVWGASNA